MTNNFAVSLLDIIWTHKRGYLNPLKGDNHNDITILDYGFKCEDDSFASYESVKIEDMGVVKVGSVKFFESHYQFMTWANANPLSLRSLILVIYCGAKGRTSSGYSHLSVANFTTPVEMMKCYVSLRYSRAECARILNDPEPTKREILITRLFLDRLEAKSELLRQKHVEFNQNVNDLLIFSLFDSLLISSRNRSVMGELFYTIKGGSIFNNLTEQYQFEALLLGASGLLDSATVCDEYLWKMRRTYSEIERRFSLRSMNSSRWVLTSTSPRHTIAVMLAHLASLFYHHRNLLFKVIDIRTIDQAKELFKVPLSEYWQSHNYLGKESTAKSGGVMFPKSKQNTLIINTITPFLFYYHRFVEVNESEDIADMLITLMQNCDHEVHKYTNQWSGEGVSNRSAFESQALTQLSKCHCDKRLCFGCPIGISLLLGSLTRQSKR